MGLESLDQVAGVGEVVCTHNESTSRCRVVMRTRQPQVGPCRYASAAVQPHREIVANDALKRSWYSPPVPEAAPADPSRPLRVLHLLTALGHGGAEVWLLNMLRTMPRSEVAQDYCLKSPSAGTREGEARDLGAEVFHNELRPSHVGYLRGLERILREGRYDVVHSHEFVYSGIGVWTARRMGVPIVCTLHHYQAPPETEFTRRRGVRELRSLYGRASMAYTLSRANFVTTLSQAVALRIDPKLQHSPRFRLLRLSAQAPAPMDEAERRSIKASLDLPPDAPLVLHVGRFIEQKNHQGVLDIFAQVRAKVPTAHLVLLGVGPLLETVLARVEKESRGAIHYLGLRSDAQRLMAAADVFLFPSLDEGFGLAALEANAAGTPVVGSRIPGLDEAVLDGETAFLHPLHQVPAMASDVVRLLVDPELRRSMGARGRNRAKAEFSHQASAARLLSLYREATGHPTP